MAQDDDPLPLQSLYLHLVRAGFALSVRDYEDALRAIRLGHGAGGRAQLLALCTALWARGDEEVMRLQAVFRAFARPSVEAVRQLSGRADPVAPAGGAVASASGLDAPPAPADDPAAPAAPRAEFVAATETGVALPSARTAGRAQQAWLLQPRPPLALRALVIAWRRYRLAQRSGPPVELDIEATVQAQCRSGWLLQPVLVPARRNQARLLVLVDASPSMAPWRGLHAPLAESLQQGRLGQARLYFFDNDPRQGLYDSPELGGLHDCDDVLRAHGDGAVLVIGDAGSVRGRRDRHRQAGLRALAQGLRRQGARLAWLNPMPRERWGEAPRALQPWALMAELGEDGLTHAVDFLRGTKAA